MGVSPTICLGWPWTLIFPIAVSLVARITGMSYQCHLSVQSLKLLPCCFELALSHSGFSLGLDFDWKVS
jgi:hypothetical protein